MIQKLGENFYVALIPLPKSPLKNLNCYIFCDTDYNLIIDTGFNQPECQQALEEAIQELNLDLHKTILFITHLHSDHCGLASFLQDKGAKVLSGQVDGERIEQMFDADYWEFFEVMMRSYDLAKYDFTKNDHPGFRYRPADRLDCEKLAVGSKIKTGRYEFTVLDLSGHTPGQVGLWEENHKYLFSGDHILSSISPNIVEWTDVPDSLGTYLKNLKMVYDLDLHMIYPSHRELISDYRKRIQELLDHHAERLQEVRDILGEQTLSVSDVASGMTWDIRAKSWEDFPKGQKWFASGEAAAHLEHLRFLGEVECSKVGDISFYKKVR